MKYLIFSLTLSFISQNTLALVDYTESSSVSIPVQRKAAPRPVIQRAAPRAATKNSTRSGMLDFDLGYRQVDVNHDIAQGKATFLELKGHLQTQYNLYLDFNYWGASSDDSSLAEGAGYQKGNPRVVLGFNWLRFGKAEEMATIDLYVGGEFSGNTEFSSSRTDKIAGIETSKRFYNFALALGYEYVLTGTAKDEEVNIGNISNLKASLGWVVSPDIQFAIEANNYTIADDKNNESAYKLREKVSFASVTPMMNLGISPLISLKMGATFRTKKAKHVDQLLAAKLWSLPGVYGNSLFVGLNVAI
jgi:hypothetical protein